MGYRTTGHPLISDEDIYYEKLRNLNRLKSNIDSNRLRNCFTISFCNGRANCTLNSPRYKLKILQGLFSRIFKDFQLYEVKLEALQDRLCKQKLM